MPTAPRLAVPLWFTDTRMTILVAEETCSLVDAEAERGNMPPLHVHHDEDEVFYVVAGRLSVLTPGSTVTLAPGEAAFAPRGIPHTYRVESDTARWTAATTAGGFASFVAETSTTAAADGYAPPELMPEPAVLAEAAARQGIEILGPPGATP